MNECRVCHRTDLPLTANGRIKSHTVYDRPGEPNCGGGSDLPYGVDQEVEQPMRVVR